MTEGHVPVRGDMIWAAFVVDAELANGLVVAVLDEELAVAFGTGPRVGQARHSVGEALVEAMPRAVHERVLNAADDSCN